MSGDSWKGWGMRAQELEDKRQEVGRRTQGEWQARVIEGGQGEQVGSKQGRQQTGVMVKNRIRIGKQRSLDDCRYPVAGIIIEHALEQGIISEWKITKAGRY